MTPAEARSVILRKVLHRGLDRTPIAHLSWMINGARTAVLECDAAIDQAVIRLYRAELPAERARLTRDLQHKRRSLRLALGLHPVAPGDLRRR